MKNISKFPKTMAIAACIFTLFSINACSDENLDTPLGQAMNDFFTKNKLVAKKFSLTLSTTGATDTLKLGSGYALIVAPGTFLINGVAATGTLDVSATLVDTKSDMVKGGVSTYGDSGRAIQSSGMLKLNVSQNGVQATIALAKPLSIQVPMKGMLQTDFRTFSGGNDGSDSSKWVLDNKSQTIPKSQSYIIKTTTLKWINCDRFYNNSSNVKFDVKVPTGFTNVNASVFIIFKNDHSMCRLFGNAVTQTFDFGNYPGIPLSTPVKIVVISSEGDQLKFAEQDYIGATGTVSIPTMTNTTDAELQTFLNSL